MTGCKYCGTNISYLGFHCRRCDFWHCDEHRLPEGHECSGLRKGNIFYNLRNRSQTSKKDNSYDNRVYNRPSAIFQDHPEAGHSEGRTRQSNTGNFSQIIVSIVIIVLFFAGIRYFGVVDYFENLTVSDKSIINSVAQKTNVPKPSQLSGAVSTNIKLPNFRDGSKEIRLEYTLNKTRGSFDFEVYKGLSDYLRGKSRQKWCYEGACPSDEEIQLEQVFYPEQTGHLEELVQKIKSLSDNPEVQARIAISAVQRIPYDTEGFKSNSLNNRYPYEVLYDQKGVCGEKSKLLAYLLIRLGFGTVLFDFEEERHQAIGIKCPQEYSFKNTGYCFIETTAPTIITDSDAEYVNIGKLTSTPEIIQVGDGMSFNNVKEDYKDMIDYAKLRNAILRSDSPYMNEAPYNRWNFLTRKYGLQV